MSTVACARFLNFIRCLSASVLLVAAQSVSPTFAAAEPPTAAAAPVSSGQWFISLLKTYNSKSFCIPGTAHLAEVAEAFAQYTQSHQLARQPTTPEAVQILVQIYPCQAASTAANAAVQNSDEAAAPVGLPTIDIMRALQNTSGHENDVVLDDIKRHSDAYPPPVFFGLARVLFRQGDVDGAIFWFNAGRLRGNFDAWRATDVVSGRATMIALSRQMPIELRKAQFDDLPKLRAIVAKAIAWDETTPRNYDRRWIDFHGVAANRARPGDDKTSLAPATIPPEKWDDLAKRVREQYRKDLELSITMMSNAKIAAPQR